VLAHSDASPQLRGSGSFHVGTFTSWVTPPFPTDSGYPTEFVGSASLLGYLAPTEI
jgi:hypothetical protein